MAVGVGVVFVLGILGSLTKSEVDPAIPTASAPAVAGLITARPIASPTAISEPAPSATAEPASATTPEPTPKPAPTPIVDDVVVDVTTSHKFSGKKQTYTWTEVALEFDKALYKVSGAASKTKACSVTWGMSDGIDRDGFTLKVAAGATKTQSHTYKSAVTDGALKVASTCKSWSVKVSEYVPPTGVYGNPWLYDFKPGKRITNPPDAFCSYFDCIPSFWDSTNGYVVQCRDGTFSHSGGRQGACSYHSGVRRPLYRH